MYSIVGTVFFLQDCELIFLSANGFLVYVDIDVTIFDASGISETNMELRDRERRRVLEETLPSAVLNDYNSHAFDMEQMDRLRRHKMYWIAYLVERVLFKMEKWGILRK